MTAPICAQVVELLESVWNAVIDLFLVWIALRIRLADTFGDNACVTFSMTSVFAVFTLHSRRVFQEVATESTTHDVVELLSDKLVTIHLVDLFLSLSDGTFSVET